MKSILLSCLTALLVVALVGCDQMDTVDETSTSEVAWTMDAPFALDATSKNGPASYLGSLISFPLGESVEGIAIDRRGNMYVGKRTWGASTISQIVRVERDGTASLVADLPTSGPGTTGVLGLVTDPSGRVYAAMVTDDPSTQGVYRISKDGLTVERLPGSEQIAFANALTFDRDGNLYVTDSFTGKIWQYGQGSFTEWLQHPLLEAVPVPGAPAAIPGANGIAFYPPNKLYVANTSQFSITRVYIEDDRSAGAVESIVPFDFGLFAVDGIALDAHEMIYGVLAPANAEETGAPPVPPVVTVDPATGTVGVLIPDPSNFDTPTSLAFGTGGAWGRKTLYVANAALYGPVTNGPGSGVVEVYAGIPGLPN
ncbi:MAG: SMP-30/gluconolactonase/LRE family protein [Rhodothermales bacterium]